jgi:integrase
MKASRKQGIDIKDIALDLDTSKDKPDWVYLTEEEVRKLCSGATYKYEVLIWFLFDTGIRAPTELVNVKVSDFFNDFKELNIREETSKTFGRRIKVMLCSSIIKEYVKNQKLSPNDYLFKINHGATNRCLKRLAKRTFGDKASPAGEKYSNLTLYDFRHNSCCYWLPRYKSECALKYRFGWKKSDKIHYYSELLGMRDTISEDDMLLDITKTEIEQKLQKAEKENVLMKEQLDTLQKQITTIGQLTQQLYTKVLPKEVVIHL